jgi:ubiquinone/menaquinone biosynthesis C-methylase UbiE
MKNILILAFTFFFLKQNTNAQKTNTDSLLIAKHKVINDFLALTDKDVVADVGTSSGYSLVPIAGANPNIIFTVEDIDSSTLNRKKLIAQIKRFGNRANIDQFNIVYGTETSTNLPSASFTKVLMFDVVHEIAARQIMLDDIKRILQKGGSLFIEEVLVYKPAKFILKKEKISFATGNKKYMKLFEYTVAD